MARELNIVLKYLSVTLDRIFSFEQHSLNTKAKVSARNNIIRKLTNFTWVPHVKNRLI